jgi:hypothetical protein
MKTLLTLLYLAVVWLAPVRARAGSAEPDFAAIAMRVCESRAKTTPSAKQFCAWQPYVDQQLPQQFFKIAMGVDPCQKKAGLSTLVEPEDAADLAKLCGGKRTHLVAAETFDNLGVNLVLGLGDLLQEEAKQEIIDFLIEQVGHRFCEVEIPIGSKGTKITFLEWFAQSCKAMFPNGLDGSVEAEAFSFGALKTAFRGDLEALPKLLGPMLTDWLDSRWGANAKVYAATVGVLLYVIFEYGIQHKTPFEIVKEIGDRAHTTPALTAIKCNFTTGQNNVNKECIAALLFELAYTTAIDLHQDSTTPLATLTGDTLVAFCKIHGPTEELKEGGTCAISPSDYAVWHTRLKQFYRAIKHLLDLTNTMINLTSSEPPREVARKIAPDLVDGLRGVLDTFADIAEHLPSVSTADATQIKDDAAVMDAAVDTFDAIVSDDPGAFSKAVLELVGSKLVAKHLSSAETHAFTVVAALATAKDRTAVRDILKGVAAPVGTYKMKFGGDHVVITLNGLVGFFVGGEWTVRNKLPDGSSGDSLRSKHLPFKLSAPVGFDMTFTSGLACWHLGQPGSCYNIGATVTLLDPFALAISTANDTISADWKTLLEPGLYLRIGLFKSPLAVLIGGNYQPGIRSPDTCGGSRCFQGAIQLGALLSADVPVFILH